MQAAWGLRVAAGKDNWVVMLLGEQRANMHEVAKKQPECTRYAERNAARGHIRSFRLRSEEDFSLLGSCVVNYKM
jgi:hypothetical protein